MTRMLRGMPPLLMLSLGVVPAVGCNVDNGDPTPAGEATHVDRVFSGFVVDENGYGLADVIVTSADGTMTGKTNAIGQFILLMPTDDGRSSMELLFEKEGYMRSNASIPMADETSHYSTMVTLSLIEEVQTLPLQDGGTLEFAGGKLKLSFPPSSFADSDGNPIDAEEVEIAAKLIEPETLSAATLPVPSMLARDPATPGQDVLIASFGMFIMDATVDGEPVYPAGDNPITAEITGMERFVQAGTLDPDSAIPFWTMDEDETTWNFAGWWAVVPTTGTEGARAGKATEDDDDLVESDNTLYSVVTDVPVGTYGTKPPPTRRYNCDARPILSCVRGTILAEGLYGNTDSGDGRPEENLSTAPVGGAWVGFDGTGQAEYCSQCECVERKVVEVCEEVTLENGDTVTQCHNEEVEETTYPRPDNSGIGDACPSRGNQTCQCKKYEEQTTLYQGSAYSDSSGHYCANVGARGRIEKVTILKEWLITETDPKTGQRTSYPVSYEFMDHPRGMNNLGTGHVCEDGEGDCATYDHTMPCEWFWMNGACAVVGGCEVHHLRDYDEEDRIDYYE